MINVWIVSRIPELVKWLSFVDGGFATASSVLWMNTVMHPERVRLIALNRALSDIELVIHAPNEFMTATWNTSKPREWPGVCDRGWIMTNPNWPSGYGPCYTRCPGCPACEAC